MPNSYLRMEIEMSDQQPRPRNRAFATKPQLAEPLKRSKRSIDRGNAEGKLSAPCNFEMALLLEKMGVDMAAQNLHPGDESLLANRQLAETRPCDDSQLTGRQLAESLLTKRQLADTLRLSKRSIDRHIAEGKLPKGFLVGGARRWRRAEIDLWIACGCPIVNR